MRYDTPVYFQVRTPGAYDSSTGDYAADSVTETKVYANVTDSGDSAISIVYGTLKQGSKTIRLQNGYTAAFDTIRIGSKIYKVDFTRSISTKATFVVSEEQ